MKTLRSFSRRGALLAAGFFAALTLDPAAALHAQGAAAPPEAVSPANLFLPPTGVYGKDAASPNLVWANGVQCRVFKIEFPSASIAPPAAGAQVQTVDCLLRLELSNDGGATYQPVTLPAAVTVRIEPNAGGQNYDAEWMSMSATGPGLLRIRESPTLASTGQHTVRAVFDGSFRTSSFFDVFTEISVDGGQNWSPATAAVHCPLTEPGECATASAALPPAECVLASQSDIVFANGVVLHNVRLRDPVGALPPPPPGGSQVVPLTMHASGQIAGGGYVAGTWGGDCIGTCSYTSQLDSVGVRFFATEMLSLSLSGGGLPAGVMIRESPTKASLGRTSARVTSTGQNFIGSFFDIFTELSVDGGATWSPSVGSPTVFKGELAALEPVPYVWPTDTPLPAGVYRTIVTANPSTLTFTQSDIAMGSVSCPMAPGGTVTTGPTGPVHTKRSEAEFDLLSIASGASALVRAEVEISLALGSTTAGGERPIECVSFTITNTGTMPSGVLLRESPTRHSIGRTTVTTRGDYFAIDSFFDVFFEVSQDNGATWAAADDPLRLMLAPPVPVDTFDSVFFPPRNGAFSQGTAPYFRPVDDVTRYAATGIHIRNLGLRAFATSQQPPAVPGTPQIQDDDCDVVCELSLDGGLSFFPVTVPATCFTRTTRRGGSSVAVFDTEMLALNLSGGGLPPGVMIRESPTKASTGKLRESPTLPSTGRVHIDSFFDIFTEVSIDGGATWTPSESATHLELSRNVPAVFSSSDWLPLRGQMESDEDGGTAAYDSRTVVKKVIIVITDGIANRVPPPGLSEDITKISAITMRMSVSLDGGGTLTDATATGAMTVRTHGSGGGGGGGGAGGLASYDTEMLALDLSGGTLPAGMMIRESPTKQSTGKTTVILVDGGFRIGSFFDIFTELSLDGGATWSPCDEPMHFEHVPTGQPRIVESNLLPPRGDYNSPSGDVALYCATGQHIKSAKLFCRSTAPGVPPPPVGGTASGSLDFEISFLYSDDGGLSYTRKSGAFTSADFDYKATSFVNDTTNYDAEITALQIAGGTLPAGTMIRESPTKQSLGKTVSRALPDGTYSVAGFFDIFTELSTDGGTTWEPFDQALHVEMEDVLAPAVVPTDNFPPPGSYTQQPQAIATFFDGVMRDLTADFTSPPAPLPPLGGSSPYALSGTAQCTIQLSGSPPLTATCSVQAQVLLTHTFTDGADRVFDTEMLSLQLAGGGLPAGLLVRESPTRPSKGQHVVRNVTANHRVTSFFDVFLELSTDGGATWSPSDGTVRLAFELPPTPPVVTIAPASDVTWKSATLHGSVNPNGKPTTAQFEYGTTAFDNTAAITLVPNDGTTAQTVGAPLTGLLPATTYQCRVHAVNADGTTYSAVHTFTTPDKPFRVWALANLGDADAPPLGTPDGDGLTNLVKYGCLLPTGTSAVHLLPRIRKNPVAGGSTLTVFVPRDPLRDDLTIIVEMASSMEGPWIPVATSTGGAAFTGPGVVEETDPPGLPGVKMTEVTQIPTLSVSIAFAKIRYIY